MDLNFDYLQTLLDLLPSGPIWNKDADSNLTAAVSTLVPTVDRLSNRAGNLLTDSFISTTEELLPEWEETLGLPDPCLGSAPTIAQRRAQAVARFVAGGNLSPQFYINYAKALGFDISVTEYSPFFADIGGGDGLLTNEYSAYSWLVTTDDVAITLFEADVSGGDEPLWQAASDVLQCEISRLAPAFTQVLYSFESETGTGDSSGVTQVLTLLANTAGNNTISGQFIERGGSGWAAIEDIQASTGKWLGLIGGDYWYSGSTEPTADTAFNSFAKNFWNAGGLIALTLSMPNPTTGGSSNDTSSLNVTDLFTSGTATNTAFITALASVADGLQALQNSGVVVIIRPYHEQNGNWNWFSTACLTGPQYGQLWQYTYNYLTATCGLSNLIWSFSANAGVTDGLPIDGYWPGDDYVDLYGIDGYTSNPAVDLLDDYNYWQANHSNKLFWLSEFGPGDPTEGDTSFSETTLISALQTAMPLCIGWQQWWDGNVGGPGWGMAEVLNLSTALDESYVLNRGDFAN